MSDTKRRDFIGYSFAGVAAVGAGFGLYGAKRAWDILPSVKSAGFTKIDLAKAGLEEGVAKTFVWRGKPIFILKKTSSMEKSSRDLVIGNDRYNIVIGICTHLGCIPEWKKKRSLYKCACHGGEFNSSGKQVFGPPPKPFNIPPFSVSGTTIVLGESGKEYKAIEKAQQEA